MRICLTLSFAMLFAAGVGNASASDVVIERGDAMLTLADIDARMQRLPDHERPDFAHRPDNLARMMDQLLLNRQLANEARSLGLDQDPKVKHDLVLAAEEVLAVHRLNQLVATGSVPDFEPLARERYLADPSAHAQRGRRVVEHVLVAIGERSEEDALERALEVHAAAIAGRDFAQLVEQYSEDPGKVDNAGRYELLAPGTYVPEFERTANELEEVGQISEPVRTDFGFHVLRLVEASPPRERSFDEVRQHLVDKLREDYLKSARERHSAELRSLPDQGNEELLRSLRARYGGDFTLPGAGGASN